VFASTRADGSTFDLYWQRADGTGDVQPLTDRKVRALHASSWHPTGKFLAFEERNPQTGSDLMILPMDGDEKSGWKPGMPTVLLNSSFNESEPMFSPDGRWLAYFSDETGRNEVFVRPFPGPGGKEPISTGGGTYPTWSRTRSELFYAAPDQAGPRRRRIMVVPYTVEQASFRADKPRLWSERAFRYHAASADSTCIRTANASHWPRYLRRKPKRSRTRLSSSSTSSTSYVGSHLRPGRKRRWHFVLN
jgi:Tol biopolymer transport system component